MSWSEQPSGLAVLVEHAPIGFALSDTESRYTYVNAYLARLNRIAAADHVGRTPLELFPSQQLAWMEYWSDVLATGEPRLDMELAEPGGRFYALVSYLPLFAADGTVSGVASIVLDVTPERQRAETLAQLQRTEAELARLLERERQSRTAAERAALQLLRLQDVMAAFAETMSADQAGEVFLDLALPMIGAQGGGIGVLNASHSALELLCTRGYPPDLVASFQTTPLDAPVPYAEVPRTGQPFWCERWEDMVARYPHVAGMEPTSGPGASIHLPLIGGGEIVGVAVFQFAGPRTFTETDRLFVTLLTRQCAQALDRAQLYAAERRARETAEAATRLRDEFLSVAAHEFRSPLTALLGQARILEQRLRRAELLSTPNERSLSVITGQAQRLANMITDLLDISRLESGQLQIATEPVDLAQIAQQVVQMTLATPISHMLFCHVPDAPVIVIGDRVRLEQVLQNLIANAVKYSAEGSNVVVAVEQHGDEAWLLVRDSGVGIPPQALTKLFDRFYRVPGAQQQIEGIGVGLYVVSEIVRLHGGRVDVHSVVDHGSVFVVKLPIA